MIRSSKYRMAGLLGLCLLLASTLRAGNDGPAACRSDDRLSVCLPLTADTDLASDERLTVTPFVVNGRKRMPLPAVVFTGRARQRADERRERRNGRPALPADAYGKVVVRNGRKHRAGNAVIYRVYVPFEPWMQGGAVVLCRDLEGRAGRTSLPPMFAVRIHAPVRPRLSFLVPEEAVKRSNVQITAAAHFPPGSSVLLRGFADNSARLEHVDSLIARLLDCDGLTVESIRLTGCASTEGNQAANARLSAGRAESFRNYLREKFGLQEDIFILEPVPGAWDSLRRRGAASDQPARDEALAVGDTVSDPQARAAGIRRIAGGRTARRLPREVGPRLRRVDCRIDYTLPAYTLEQSRELIGSHPERLGVGELCRLAASFPPDAPERAWVCALALEHYPDDVSVCNNMAMLALCRGDMPAARSFLSRCAGDPRVRNNLGVLCLIEGDLRRAACCFSLAAHAGSQEAAYNLAHWDELLVREDGVAAPGCCPAHWDGPESAGNPAGR